MYNLSRLGELRKGGNPVKKLVAGVALAAALVVPAVPAGAADCRVCTKKCGTGYLVYWYDLDNNYHVLLNACVYQ